MCVRVALVPAVLLASFASAVAPTHAASTTSDRGAYLGQASKAGPDAIVARNFLATAAAPSRFFDEKSLLGPAASAVAAWLGDAHEHCTPPGTAIELECRTRGLVDAAQMVYVGSPDRAREWAVVTLHTSPDEGNVGYERILLFKKGAGGYAFHAVADARGYQPGNFADDDGSMTYVGFTGTPSEAMDGKGPRQRFRIVGQGGSATVVEDSPATKRGPSPSDRSNSDETAAVEIVKAIYRGSSAYGVMASKNPALMRPYLTSALIDAWLHPAPNSAYDFDGDPLTWTQMTDAASVVSATPHDFKDDRGMVRVAVRAVVENVPRIVTIDWMMLKVGDRWLADDNLGLGHSLRAELTPKPIGATVPTGASVRQRASASMAANGGPDAYVADHNGSLVTVSPSLGTIAYIHARPGMDRMVGIGTVLFRGRFTPGAITGTAYVFRKGCDPAPYAVTSTGYSGTGSAFVLIGHPPIRARGSCAVVGYGDNANSVLHFEPRDEGDI